MISVCSEYQGVCLDSCELKLLFNSLRSSELWLYVSGSCCEVFILIVLSSKVYTRFHSGRDCAVSVEEHFPFAVADNYNQTTRQSASYSDMLKVYVSSFE
jgi:hypothetical protein